MHALRQQTEELDALAGVPTMAGVDLRGKLVTVVCGPPVEEQERSVKGIRRPLLVTLNCCFNRANAFLPLLESLAHDGFNVRIGK